MCMYAVCNCKFSIEFDAVQISKTKMLSENADIVVNNSFLIGKAGPAPVMWPLDLPWIKV